MRQPKGHAKNIEERKQQLAEEAKHIIGQLENEGWTLAFTDGSAKHHPKIGWVVGFGGVVMGQWETKGLTHPVTAQTNNRAEVQAIVSVLEHFKCHEIKLVIAMDSQCVYDGLNGAAFRWRGAG